MDERGQRWDTLDAQRRGYMTPDEARGIVFENGVFFGD